MYIALNDTKSIVYVEKVTHQHKTNDKKLVPLMRAVLCLNDGLEIFS